MAKTSPLGLALRTVRRARAGKTVPVVMLISLVQWVRSIHDGRGGLVLFDVRSWRVCLYETIAVYDGGMILAHCGVARGWYTLATTRVFGRCTLYSACRLAHRSIVPGLSFILAWRGRRLL
jgi:hypothetical protein